MGEEMLPGAVHTTHGDGDVAFTAAAAAALVGWLETLIDANVGGEERKAKGSSVIIVVEAQFSHDLGFLLFQA